ncbi:MAG: BREX-1 system adenine-specific DNA-methyltransferase PglX [Bacteroidales bacterium]|nr:BREX-1 system adenine-specific DNA-methyltransferase PglX [Bacteroidales bacterium]MCF8336417.1 BREX-1 system adenine-specific DNA-methyltransferase PglX [Bacteroidales bacterium]
MAQLRFAPIIRVSTEGQQTKGESLKTQTEQIKQYVRALNGVIPEHCWQYTGQEHATPEYERKKMEKLLQDSNKDLFDAVIVTDASRWSRDNLKSKEGLRILKESNIRFFVGTMEYDLFNPEQNMFLGMSAEINEFHAMMQSQKSIINRINKAKRNIPTSGHLPYGRTYSDEKGWGLDKEKQQRIQQAANRYLEGEKIDEIAKSLGMNTANLWRILKERVGSQWKVQFNNERLNIHEEITMEIPPLLDDETIKAVQERSEANRTYKHGQIKNKYLLSRMIFCKNCGYALCGTTTSSGNRYYVHHAHSRKKCNNPRWIAAQEIESAVVIQLVQTFGDVERLEKAMRRAAPDMQKIDGLQTEKTELEKDLKTLEKQKGKIIDAVADGLFDKTEIENKLNSIREKESAKQNRIYAIDAELESIPDSNHVKKLSKLGKGVLLNSTKSNLKVLFDKPYEWKRNLVERAFQGKDSQGRRLGVYVDATRDKDVTFEINGIIENTFTALPLSDEYLIDTFSLDEDYQDVNKELEHIRSNITNFIQYLVDNTLGQLWKEARPNTRITEHLQFYIKPQNEELIPKRKLTSPEEIQFFDPCVGSGHIVSYAFDFLYKIYEEEGYNPSEIPELIITKNLFGIDIDDRAAQMAAFSLMMKARQNQRKFLRKGAHPNITSFQNIENHPKFKNAKVLGSLIKINREEYEEIKTEEESLFGQQQQRLKLQADYLSRTYDVVVTNPPYLNASRMEAELKKYVEKYFPATKTDLFASFIIRCLEFANDNGLSGNMTPFVWMFISNYKELRKIIIDNYFINNLVQLEYSGFEGATVPICTFTLRKKQPEYLAKGSYIRLSDFKGSKNQAPKAIEAVNNKNSSWLYTALQDDFKNIPDYRIGYWLNRKQIEAFSKEPDLRHIYPPRAGLSTGNNNRFLRFWHEVSFSKLDFSNKSRNDLKESKKWLPMTKGGRFRKWYGNNDFIINWENDGEEIKDWLINNPNDPATNSWSRYIRNYNYYCMEGISFSDVSSGAPAFRMQEFGFIPNSRGPIINSTNEELIGFLNSKVVLSFLEVLSPTLTFNVGDVSKIPYSGFDDNNLKVIVSSCIDIAKSDWNQRESSWFFSKNELCSLKAQDIEESFDLYKQYWRNKYFQLHRNEEKVNQQFIEIYGLQNELSPNVPLENITILQQETSIENGQLIFHADEVIAQFVSYAVGCMFGRYSLDKEGLILANQGETLQDYLEKVGKPQNEISFLPDDDNVIPVLDDEWFEDDIVGRFHQFLKVTFGEENFENNLAFVEDSLGKPIRKYFMKDFYKDHIKRYKKRPIYWMLSSPNGVFNVLIYMHRYTPDTINNILNKYLREFTEKLSIRKEHLQELKVSGSTREKTEAIKEDERIDKMLWEVKEYDREILYPLATERINIDLDDGVLVNYNKFGKAVKEVNGLNDKKTKDKVRNFEWIDTSQIK